MGHTCNQENMNREKKCERQFWSCGCGTDPKKVSRRAVLKQEVSDKNAVMKYQERRIVDLILEAEYLKREVERLANELKTERKKRVQNQSKSDLQIAAKEGSIQLASTCQVKDTKVPESEVSHVADLEKAELSLANFHPVDKNFEQDENGKTSLHHAAEKGDIEALIKLIREGADVRHKDLERFTFLHRLFDCATITPSQLYEIVELLASINSVDVFNTRLELRGLLQLILDRYPEGSTSTPFQLAVKKKKVERRTLEILHENGCDFNLADNLGNTALHYALWGRRSVTVMHFLIEFGVDFRRANKDNQGLLHIAALMENSGALGFLVRKGLNVFEENKDGITPLELVVKSGNLRIRKCARVMLEEDGADEELRVKYGEENPLWRSLIGRIVHQEVPRAWRILRALTKFQMELFSAAWNLGRKVTSQ